MQVKSWSFTYRLMVRFTEKNIRVSLELSNYRQWFQFCHLALKGNAIFYRNSYTDKWTLNSF